MELSAKERCLDVLLKQFDPAARLLRVWPLAGGVSAEVTALDVQSGDGHQVTYVVRRYGEIDLAGNPDIAAAEASLLSHLHTNGLAVPRPFHVDNSGDALGSPAIVIEYVEGRHEFEPADLRTFILQMAVFLSDLHGLQPNPDLSSALYDQAAHVAACLADKPQRLDASLSEGLVRDALEAAWPPPQVTPAILHGDYWPGNILWRDGRIAAVVDWEDAAFGDPLADLANARLELLWAFDFDTMDAFTSTYQEATRCALTGLPVWDLWAGLRPAAKLANWGLAPAEADEMRAKHLNFVKDAVAALEQA